MFEEQLFNLEKIKEITSPIEELQGKISSMKEIYEELNIKTHKAYQILDEQQFVEDLGKIVEEISDINSNLLKISNENANKFLVFKDNLIQKYKDTFRDNLKKLKLNKDSAKNIGIFLIENKKISKIVEKSSFVPALGLDQWMDLLSAMTTNSIFLSTLKPIKSFYKNLISRRLEIELSKIPEGMDHILVEDYKKSFAVDPITFSTFMETFESNLSQKELKEKTQIIKKTKENAQIKKDKEDQEEQIKSTRNSYQDYFKYSEKEFERRLRRKQRATLTDLKIKKPKMTQEKSEEISEKIEKFKSQLDNTFKEKYLIQKDDELDPLDLIRERKKRKVEEYNKYFKKFEDKN